MHDTVRIIGAPTDYGASRRGVDMGPRRFATPTSRRLSRLGFGVQSSGDVSVRRVGNEAPGRDDAKYLPAIESVCTRLTETVSDALAAGETPLVLGGDHSVAIGSVVGSARGGATYREAHAALERVAHAASVRSLDLVEMNPILDDHNRTAELAVELAARALGERIL